MIIKKTPTANGAHPAPQTWQGETPPAGYAVIPDSVDLADFYEHNGFVTLTIEAVEHTRQVEQIVTVKKSREVETETENGAEIETYYEDELQIVDETYTVDTVTGYEPNVDAWTEWKASLPGPVAEEPTFEEDAAAMLVDHEYRLVLLEAGLF